MKLIPTSTTFKGWVGLGMFSVVTFGSLWDRFFRNPGYVLTSTDKWIISELAVSITLSAGMCIWYFFACRKGARDGARETEFNKYETGIAIFLFWWWIAGLVTLMDRNNEYAVLSNGLIATANTYFAAWASMGSVLYILGEISESHAETSSLRSPKLSKWWLLLASTIVIIIGCADAYMSATCGGFDSELCTETIVGLVTGSVGTFISCGSIIFVCFWEEKFSRLLESVLSLILCGMTCASVALVTSRGGPGAQVGNLYFASWIAFIVSLILLGHCMGDFCGHAPKDDDDYAAGDDIDDASSEEKSVEKAESDEMPGMLEA